MMEAAVIAGKGMRAEMEDAHLLDLNFLNWGWVLVGVYDGHNGSFAAHYAAEKLPGVFQEGLLRGLNPQAAFITSYETISMELGMQDSGTTAVNFLIKDGMVFTANTGDARAIVIGNNSLSQLTVDHRLHNPEERERIERMGGRIIYPYTYRGNLGLMPTRTIGDPYFKAVGVMATPSLAEYEITGDDFMLLAACDGLFDVMTNEEVADFARKSPRPGPLLDGLKDEVLVARAGTDNLTIIAVSLDQNRGASGT